MPLLVSPIDGSPMRQINRYGIEIDVCPTSGGVWLDRGELEKIMAILKEEEAVGIAPAPAFPEKRQRDRGYDDDRYKRDYDDDDYYKHKKKSKASKLMDIFDF